MDSFELNKILGAILGTCLGVLTINIAAGAIFAPVKPAKLTASGSAATAEAAAKRLAAQ